MDTSCLINGWRKNYPIKNFPTLWDNLGKLIKSGEIRATVEVQVELKKQDDELLKWTKEFDDLFVDLDVPIQTRAAEILSQYPQLVNTMKNRSQADPFVIALADINKCTVLSEEGFSNNLNKPKIPDVCKARNVNCIKLVDLIRSEGWTFR